MKKEIVIILVVLLVIVNICNISAAKQKSNISLNLDWNDNEIKNGDEFQISISASNLENKDYDIKIYVYDSDKNKPISQTYSEDDGKWAASTTYIKNFFSGPGDSSKEIKMRIKNKVDFYGEANIGVRIRENSGKSYIKEDNEKINILKASDSENSDKTDAEKNVKKDSEKTKSHPVSVGKVVEDYNVYAYSKNSSDGIIYLKNPEAESIKSKKNIVFLSKNEAIKTYSILGFVILIVVFFVVLVFWRKKNSVKN